jgi:hypothetical protein
MLVTKESLSLFPEDVMTVSDLWRPIQRFKKTSYTEIGVLSALSAPIARGNVPLLYTSTFLSAFIFGRPHFTKFQKKISKKLKISNFLFLHVS